MNSQTPFDALEKEMKQDIGAKTKFVGNYNYAGGKGEAKFICETRHPLRFTKAQKQKYADCVKTQTAIQAEKQKNRTNPLKKGELFPVRMAFLSLVNLNFVGLADALIILKDAKDAKTQSKWQKFVSGWKQKFGGTEKGLNNAVNRGRKHAPALKKFFKKYFSADGDYMNATGGAGKLLKGTAEALGVASGVLLAIPEPSGTTKAAAAWVGAGAAVMGASSQLFKDAAPDAPDVPPPAGDRPEADKDEAEKAAAEDAEGTKNILKYFLIGGGILAVSLITFLIVKAVKKNKNK